MTQTGSRFGFFFALLAGGALLATACSAPTLEPSSAKQGVTDDEDDDGSTVSKNTNDGTTTDTTPSTPAPGTDQTPQTPADPTPSGGQCSSSADAMSCFECCDPNGTATAAADEAWGRCVCQTPGVCASACGTSFCRGSQPTAACEQCLENSTAQCDQVAEQACDATCQAAIACFDSSACYDKQ